MQCHTYKKSGGFALLALILYLGALATLCVSVFGSHFTLHSKLSSGLESLHAISDMARMCAEDMAARISRMPNIQSGFTFKLYGHRCVLNQVVPIEAEETRIVVVFHYFDHYIFWWTVTDPSGFIVRREKI